MNLIDKIKYRIEVRKNMLELARNDAEIARLSNDPKKRAIAEDCIMAYEDVLIELQALLEVD